MVNVVVQENGLHPLLRAAGQYTVTVWATDDGTTVAPSGDPTWSMPVAVASDGPSVSIDTGPTPYAGRTFTWSGAVLEGGEDATAWVSYEGETATELTLGTGNTFRSRQRQQGVTPEMIVLCR